MINLIIYIVLWLIVGLLLTPLINRIIDLPINTSQGSIITLLIGLIILLPTIRDERKREIFFEGAQEKDEWYLSVGALFLIPSVLIILILVGWWSWFIVTF